ncbi:futalosine hydrolase [Streptomyces sp. GS7]|uniref:futalosine hydrolase n=1 Tax=Streptomyces sp. GS7 TaxID=2692234 RepID=UPI001318286D|nr:futalosine hydrolase [Streptomyces sp. GS7]QHC25944.1 futalosine hydrolase [Streptomyces sp. GS7]
MRVLVVTAVAAERDAVCGAGEAYGSRTLPGGYELRRAPGGSPAPDVLAAGVGPAAASAGTATALTAAALAGEPYGLVVSAGIGGGFAPAAPLGSVVVADAIVAADLGAETPDGFVPVTELGFGTVAHRPDPALVRAVAAAAGAAAGPVVTVSTVTGSAARAAELAARHPGVLAEAMEGFGVAEAAAAHGLPVLEIRTVSNAVGPRDRAAWRIGPALAALTGAFRTFPDALTAAAGPAPGTAPSPRRTP